LNILNEKYKRRGTRIERALSVSSALGFSVRFEQKAHARNMAVDNQLLLF
jgi:hypothetical protein